MRATAVVALASAFLVIPAAASAQDDQPQKVDIEKIYDATDTLATEVDSLPVQLNCPKYDPRDVSGDATTFSFERRPDLETGGGMLEAMLEMVIGRDGKVERRLINVVEISDRRLERSIEYWVRTCRYKPGMIGGEKVRVRIRESFRHRLDR